MDIFTTALTRVRPSAIKPDKLKVKALSKEPNSHKLTDDENHLENHDLYFLDENKHSGEQQANHSDKNEGQHGHEFFEENIVPSEEVITDKQDILHPHKSHKNDEDDDIKHLDLFI